MADNTSTTADGSVAQTVADVAKQYGVPPEVALAVAYDESRLNPAAEGDRGYFHGTTFVSDQSGPPTSFGLYQLHQGGELGNLSQSAAENAYTNASVAIPHIAAVRKKYPHMTWGQVAATAQGPANPTQYGSTIDSILTNFRNSKLDPVAYFSKIAPAGAQSDGGVSSGPTYAPGADPQQGAGTSATGNTGPVTDWIAALDTVLNPGFGWNPINDTVSVIKLVAVRGSVTGVGLILIGTGLLLMFGKEIFGAAVLAIPGGPEAATAVRTTRKAARAVTAPIG